MEWDGKDYYADLGVSSAATQAEIKRAYRTLARENHPDTNPGDAAAEARFKKAAEAYDVLGDEKKRQEYDAARAAGSTFSGFNGFNGFSANTGSGAHHANFDGLSDIFQSFMKKPSRPTRGHDVETEITVDFREAAQGTTIPIRLTGNAPCPGCHGSGSRSGVSTCSSCKGSGYESENRGAFGLSRPCRVCQGTGTHVTDPCPDCTGTGVQNKTRTITVRVPVGVVDGQRVRLAGKGEAGAHGLPAGDLFVTVHVRPDPVFTRSGDDLELTVPVSFTEAALGDTITVPTLDSPVRVKLPAGTPNGRTLRVRGRGVPKRSGGKGDLLVTVDVAVPSSLDAAASAALRAYAEAEKASGFDPRAGWAGAAS